MHFYYSSMCAHMWVGFLDWVTSPKVFLKTSPFKCQYQQATLFWTSKCAITLNWYNLNCKKIGNWKCSIYWEIEMRYQAKVRHFGPTQLLLTVLWHIFMYILLDHSNVNNKRSLISKTVVQVKLWWLDLLHVKKNVLKLLSMMSSKSIWVAPIQNSPINFLLSPP